ncbi:MAG: hypothetical protein PVJ60_02335 [Phycisphaerales bacterium]|jgi:hypothetical protein
MGIESIKAFFMWCTILNLVLLVFSSLILMFAKDWAYRMHSKFFPISREAFNVAIYSFLGLYKIFVFVFNVIPYIALVIIG